MLGKLKRKQYEALLEPLEQELVSMSRWVAEASQRVLVLFEGRDTAGKGGAINAIADRLNPRQCHVVALSKPSEDERRQWYFQRYVAHLPCAGQITLFDRSWYNRAGVEKVMGFATDQPSRGFPEGHSAVRTDARRRRNPALQILADVRPGGAGGALCRARSRIR